MSASRIFLTAGAVCFFLSFTLGALAIWLDEPGSLNVPRCLTTALMGLMCVAVCFTPERKKPATESDCPDDQKQLPPKETI